VHRHSTAQPATEDAKGIAAIVLGLAITAILGIVVRMATTPPNMR
jgi:hypothetical protein